MTSAPISQLSIELDLAKGHKSGFPLNSPLLAASGCWGFSNEYADLIEMDLLGALITNPLSWHPRKPARGDHAQVLAGGVALHTRIQNPGLIEALRHFSPKWQRMRCPVIVHLALESAVEARECIERIEEVDNVLAIELGFRHDEDPRTAAETMAAAACGLLPIVVQAPFSRASEFASLAENAGAQAVSVTAPPQATLTTREVWVEGRLYSGGLFAHTLQIVHELAYKTGLPIIAAGGIHSTTQAQALLSAGAQAVQLQSVVWISPREVNEMLRSWKH